MKNKGSFHLLLMIISGVILIITLVICILQPKTKQDIGKLSNHKFAEVSSWTEGIYEYKIIFDIDTGVKYLIIEDHESIGITPLYNTDGTLQHAD